VRAARNRALRLPIVRGDLTVHAEHHLRFLGRRPGVPQRPASPLYLHVGQVDNITHDASLLGTGTLIVSNPKPASEELSERAQDDDRHLISSSFGGLLGPERLVSGLG